MYRAAISFQRDDGDEGRTFEDALCCGFIPCPVHFISSVNTKVSISDRVRLYESTSAKQTH